MVDEQFDAVVIGAGQAGLTVSRYLSLFGVEHVVLERGQVGESWRSLRWDSFTLVTPAWMTRLPGYLGPVGTGQEFTTRIDVLEMFDRYAVGLPVRPHTAVTALRPTVGGYQLVTGNGVLAARDVVVASGALRLPRIPPVARQLADTVVQLHAGQYRNPGTLPAGSVLVVGSGQSGSQIAEELNHAGRRAYLATSRVGRAPRRYRGRDAHDWSQELGLHDQTVEQVEQIGDLARLRAPNPLLSGARGGHTLALQQLAREGVTLLGRVVDAHPGKLRLGNDLAENVRHGDESAAAFRRAVDAHVDRSGLHTPRPQLDPAEAPEPGLGGGPEELDLDKAGIGAVVWATGFIPDTGWIDPELLEPAGRGVPGRGVTAHRGLYTVGGPWLSHRGSGLLYGVGSDASRIARHVLADLTADRDLNAPFPQHQTAGQRNLPGYPAAVLDCASC